MNLLPMRVIWNDKFVLSFVVVTLVLLALTPLSLQGYGNDGPPVSLSSKDDRYNPEIYSTGKVPAIEFGVASETVPEDVGTADVVLSVSETVATAFTLNYSLSGSASRNSDYTNAGSLSVAAGATSLMIPLVITDDNAGEGDETIIITLTTGTGYTLGSTIVHTLTITDNEPVISFGGDPIQFISEASEDPPVGISADGNVNDDLTLNYSVSCTATAGSDYTITGSGTVLLDISEGSSTEIPIMIIDDLSAEETETIILTLTSGVGYSVGSPNEITLNIEDNERDAGFRFFTGESSEGDGTVRVEILFNELTDQDFTVNYKLSGTATEGTDYTIANSGTVSVSENSEVIDIPVMIIDDNVGGEGDETIIFTLESGGGYRIDDFNKEYTLTVSDNEPDANFGGAESIVLENAGTFELGVFLTKVATEDLTLNYSVSGTASASSDYSIASSGAVFIDVSEHDEEATISIAITNDNIAEGDETIILTFDSGPGYGIGQFGVHTLTIEDDEQSLSLSRTIPDQTYRRNVEIADLVLPEASGGTAPYTYTLTPTTLPTGLSYNVATRTLSGTPTAVFSQTNSPIRLQMRQRLR